jgi:hypothetical protein
MKERVFYNHSFTQAGKLINSNYGKLEFVSTDFHDNWNANFVNTQKFWVTVFRAMLYFCGNTQSRNHIQALTYQYHAP